MDSHGQFEAPLVPVQAEKTLPLKNYARSWKILHTYPLTKIYRAPSDQDGSRQINGLNFATIKKTLFMSFKQRIY